MVTKKKGGKNAKSHTEGKKEETEAGKEESETKEVKDLPSKEEIYEARKLAGNAKLDIEPVGIITPDEEKDLNSKLDKDYPEYKMIIDTAHEAGNTHEETEDELITKGYSSDLYGEYLDSKYSKKSAKDGSDFLDDGVIEEDKKQTDREKEEADKLIKLAFDAKEIRDAGIKATKAIDEAEKGKDQLDKSFAMPGQSHDNSKETVNPKPIKYRENAGEGAGTRGYTTWHCPECNQACIQEKHKWVCTSNSCLYGKPKPLPEDQIAKEITQYKLLLPDLGVSVHRVRMLHQGNGRYVIAAGQEKDIARQAIKILNKKTWKQLTSNQIKYLAENDVSKGF